MQDKSATTSSALEQEDVRCEVVKFWLLKSSDVRLERFQCDDAAIDVVRLRQNDIFEDGLIGNKGIH
jgi:hypothetical protein